MQTEPMTLSQIYFSFEGRIPRSTYWLKYYLPMMGISILAAILDFSAGTFNEDYSIGLYSSIASLLLIYPSIAIYVKRVHDRGRTGWFVLLMAIPLVNIWPAVEVMFLRGTYGPNQYGEDPT